LQPINVDFIHRSFPEITVANGHAAFGELASRRGEHVTHPDALTVGAGTKRGAECGELDLGAGHREGPGEERPVDRVDERLATRALRPERELPERQTLGAAGRDEVDEEAETPEEGWIYVLFTVGREDR